MRGSRRLFRNSSYSGHAVPCRKAGMKDISLLKRRALLASLVLAAGCTVLNTEHGYAWEADPTAPDCPQYVWKQVAAERVPGLCGDTTRAASVNTSCALGCIVISRFSEEQARHIDLWGQSLRDHEVEYHNRKKLRHPA